MAFLVGEILCNKTTGERVCLTKVYDKKIVFEGTPDIVVRRARPGEFGIIEYEEVTFFDFELESIADHAKRQVAEMILKAEAQKELIKAETKFQQELEAEEMASTPAKKRSDPSVN